MPPSESATWHHYWVTTAMRWLIETAGLESSRLRIADHASNALAHYALATSDIECGSFQPSKRDCWY